MHADVNTLNTQMLVKKNTSLENARNKSSTLLPASTFTLQSRQIIHDSRKKQGVWVVRGETQQLSDDIILLHPLQNIHIKVEDTHTHGLARSSAKVLGNLCDI